MVIGISWGKVNLENETFTSRENLFKMTDNFRGFFYEREWNNMKKNKHMLNVVVILHHSYVQMPKMYKYYYSPIKQRETTAPCQALQHWSVTVKRICTGFVYVITNGWLTWEERLQNIPSNKRHPGGYKEELLYPENIAVVQSTWDLKDTLIKKK